MVNPRIKPVLLCLFVEGEGDGTTKIPCDWALWPSGDMEAAEPLEEAKNGDRGPQLMWTISPQRAGLPKKEAESNRERVRVRGRGPLKLLRETLKTRRED